MLQSEIDLFLIIVSNDSEPSYYQALAVSGTNPNIGHSLYSESVDFKNHRPEISRDCYRCDLPFRVQNRSEWLRGGEVR